MRRSAARLRHVSATRPTSSERVGEERMCVPRPGTTCRVNLSTVPPLRKVRPFWCKYQEHHTGHQNRTRCGVTQLPKSPCMARRSIDNLEDQFLPSSPLNPLSLGFKSPSWRALSHTLIVGAINNTDWSDWGTDA